MVWYGGPTGVAAVIVAVVVLGGVAAKVLQGCAARVAVRTGPAASAAARVQSEEYNLMYQYSAGASSDSNEQWDPEADAERSPLAAGGEVRSDLRKMDQPPHPPCRLLLLLLLMLLLLLLLLLLRLPPSLLAAASPRCFSLFLFPFVKPPY